MASFRCALLLLLYSIVLKLNLCDCATPYAATKLGIIQGTQKLRPENNTYLAFQGIPYAKPPTAQRRWQLPEPFGYLGPVYEATAPKAACPQDGKGIEMSEDCLYLDVYVPGGSDVSGLHFNLTLAMENVPKRSEGFQPLPVMIWIHGGSFRSGHGMNHEAGKLVTEQRIIVVVVQYRLSYLGFLSSGDEALPGNYGLWDQRLAMLWVKDNIGAFGGDPGKVTVAGESAGAASVSMHSISRQSSGIFQNVVSMSGAVECSWCFNKQPKAAFQNFAVTAGCNGTETSLEDTVFCLRNKPLQTLSQAALATEVATALPFVPVIDGDFLTDTAENLLKDKDYLNTIGFYDYKFLSGVLNNEGAVVYEALESVYPGVKDTGLLPYDIVDAFLIDVLVTPEIGLHGQDVNDAVNFQYFYPRDPTASSCPVKNLLDAYADAFFAVPAVKLARHHVDVLTSSGGFTGTGSTTLSPSVTTSYSSSVTPINGSSPTPSLLPSPVPSQSPFPFSATPKTPSQSVSPIPSRLPTSVPSETPTSPTTYLYDFDWYPSVTEGTVYEGMYHGLDVPYLFDLSQFDFLVYGKYKLNGSFQEEDHKISRAFADIVGAFVRTGDPNNGIPEHVKGTWHPYDVSNETYYRITLPPTVDRHMYASRVSLWTDLVPRLHSRWLEENAAENGKTSLTIRPVTTAPPSTMKVVEKHPEFSKYSVTESEADVLITSLIVVCAILLLVCVVLFCILLRNRTKAEYSTSHNKL